MSSDYRSVQSPDRPTGPSASGQGRRAAATAASPDTKTAIQIRRLVERGNLEEARERFSDLVESQQRRALRIAYHYLRDAAEAEEAVQDAFVKVFAHIHTYREAWPFEVWFTRILINGCLDRRKARARRDRWMLSSGDSGTSQALETSIAAAAEESPEARLLARERRAQIAAAVDRLDGRQRLVFTLCQYGDCTPREVSAITGLNESTVRVHLFRAARRLRTLLGGAA